MKHNVPKQRRINRRSFLRGAGGIAVGLPFLEGMPIRSAWAANEEPTFSFFIVTANGVIQNRFWPTATGSLSAATMQGTALEPLTEFASNLLVVRGIRAPGGSSANCGHAQGYVQSLTGAVPASGGNRSTSGGPSADMVISNALNAPGTDPLTLYSGSQRGAYIAERTSFSAAGTPARPAQLNPYETFRRLMLEDLGDANALDELLLRRRSVNDVVLEEFNWLSSRSELSVEDRRRLDNHMAGIRQLELDLIATGNEMNGINSGAACGASDTLTEALDAFRDGIQFNSNSHMIEDLVRLHGETVALAFACGANMTATLQWGNGTDGTVYQTNSRGGYNTFHRISHQTDSEVSSGNDSFAREAHIEIDRIRMTTFSHVVRAFSERGLLDQSFIYLTNSLSDGRSHAFNPLPVVIAGNGGGVLRQGEYIDVGTENNSRILASLISTAGVPTENFGAGGGQLDAIFV